MSRFPSFAEFFTALWQDESVEPFPWQERLARKVQTEGWPRAIALPTGTGKTTVIDVWTWALAAGSRGRGLRQPRRLFFVIDRRIVVDSVHARARTIATRLAESEREAVQHVAQALLELGGTEPLIAARLRGGLEIDRGWAEDLAQPVVCATTVDQIGSRLLFRGYGLSRWRRNPLPIHAALVGNDALVVVDEAHLSTAFDETLDVVETLRNRALEQLGLPWACVRMTATPRSEPDGTFRLDDTDRADERLRRRLDAAKPVRLVETHSRKGRDAIADAVVAEVSALLAQDEPRTIAAVVNRVARARSVAERVEERNPGVEVVALIGPSRPFERDRIVGTYLPRLQTDRRRDGGSGKIVVVATQTIEVGADLDFDALVTECAPADALRQRFGRLDRAGALAGAARGAIVYAKAKGPDPVYGSTIEPTWEWLTRQAVDGVVDVGPRRLVAPPPETFSPVAHAPFLFAEYVDRLAQTTTVGESTHDPDVSVFLHGPDSSPPDVEIVWRADLDPEGSSRWKSIVALAPPSGREALRIGLPAARRWLERLPSVDVADVEGGRADEEDGDLGEAHRPVLRWRGPQSADTKSVEANQLAPGDTIVVPAGYGGCDEAGWAPELRGAVADLVEGVAQEDGSPLLRLHRSVLAQHGVEPELVSGVLTPDEDDASLLVADLETIERVIAQLAAADSELAPAAHALVEVAPDSWEIVVYPDSSGVLVSLRDDVPDLGDDEGELAGGDVLLRDHQNGVAELVRRTTRQVGLDASLAETVAVAAEHHDEGKRDLRFQRLLAGTFVAETDQPLAKGRAKVRDRRAREQAWKASGLPRGFRHETSSLKLFERRDDIDDDLARHLISAHHGCARPYLPWTDDSAPWIDVADLQRMDGEVPERFWRLTRRFGWWGLAYLETLLRLADHRRSALERQ